jgi:ribosomal protein S6
MNKYQLTCLISLKLDSEQIIPYQEKLADQLKEFGANVLEFSEPKEQVLAFGIKGEKKAWVINFLIESDSEKIPELKTLVEKDSHILRNMISLATNEKEPSRRKARSLRHEANKSEDSTIKKESPDSIKESEEAPSEGNLDDKINEILNWE